MARRELEDTILPLEYTEAIKLTHPDDREPAVRIYCTGSPVTHGEAARWALQVRAPLKIKRGRVGRDFIVATASLPIDTVRELRDLCNKALSDYAHRPRKARR